MDNTEDLSIRSPNQMPAHHPMDIPTQPIAQHTSPTATSLLSTSLPSPTRSTVFQQEGEDKRKNTGTAQSADTPSGGSVQVKLHDLIYFDSTIAQCLKTGFTYRTIGRTAAWSYRAEDPERLSSRYARIHGVDVPERDGGRLPGLHNTFVAPAGPSTYHTAPISVIVYQFDYNNSNNTSAGDSNSASHQSAKYLSLVPVQRSNYAGNGSKLIYNPLSGPTEQPQASRDHEPRNQNRPSYRRPMKPLAVEIYKLIASYLSRDDIEAMRLVNREFEDKMAGPFFRSVVVPLNAEIYHKIDGPGHLQWRHAKDDPTGKVYEEHGLRVFEGFGHHILKFGMSFEVDEATLRKGLPKHPLKRVMAFYGEYDWLDPQYCRSADRDGLECTAYEISTMKLAFSHLHRVQELALSLDSGLGWLSGPDNSLRARVLHRSPAIFGSARNGPDRKTQAQIELWVLSKRRMICVALATA
ncbi:hypothetical protein LTR28_007774 [Elasticomyces elasticus]|nr:hypothetical protein LTR28_007774 [Elasticomyces elasticus]